MLCRQVKECGIVMDVLAHSVGLSQSTQAERDVGRERRGELTVEPTLHAQLTLVRKTLLLGRERRGLCCRRFVQIAAKIRTLLQMPVSRSALVWI